MASSGTEESEVEGEEQEEAGTAEEADEEEAVLLAVGWSIGCVSALRFSVAPCFLGSDNRERSQEQTIGVNTTPHTHLQEWQRTACRGFPRRHRMGRSQSHENKCSV
jgi:hypothetical protein